MGYDQIFQDPFAFVVTVGSIVAFIRKHVTVKLDGKLVIALSILVGAGLGYVGHLLGYYGSPDWAVFGVAGGIITSGFVDFLRTLLKLFGGYLPDKTRESLEDFIEEYEKAAKVESEDGKVIVAIPKEKVEALKNQAKPKTPKAVERAEEGKTKLL